MHYFFWKIECKSCQLTLLYSDSFKYPTDASDLSFESVIAGYFIHFYVLLQHFLRNSQFTYLNPELFSIPHGVCQLDDFS